MKADRMAKIKVYKAVKNYLDSLILQEIKEDREWVRCTKIFKNRKLIKFNSKNN